MYVCMYNIHTSGQTTYKFQNLNCSRISRDFPSHQAPGKRWSTSGEWSCGRICPGYWNGKLGFTTVLSGYPPETNIAPENRPSQKEMHFPTIHFQGQAVSFREGTVSVSGFLCFLCVLLCFCARLFFSKQKKNITKLRECSHWRLYSVSSPIYIPMWCTYVFVCKQENFFDSLPGILNELTGMNTLEKSTPGTGKLPKLTEKKSCKPGTFFTMQKIISQ